MKRERSKVHKNELKIKEANKRKTSKRVRQPIDYRKSKEEAS